MFLIFVNIEIHNFFLFHHFEFEYCVSQYGYVIFCLPIYLMNMDISNLRLLNIFMHFFLCTFFFFHSSESLSRYRPRKDYCHMFSLQLYWILPNCSSKWMPQYSLSPAMFGTSWSLKTLDIVKSLIFLFFWWILEVVYHVYMQLPDHISRLSLRIISFSTLASLLLCVPLHSCSRVYKTVS